MKIRKAEYDFTEQGLPSNRVEVFFDSLKLRYGLIMKTGLLLFVFMMPLLAAFFTKDAYIVSIQSLLAKGEITEASYEAMYSMVCRIAYLACVPCFMIFSLGLAGALRVFRQLIWGEGIFFIQDFFDGRSIQRHIMPHLAVTCSAGRHGVKVLVANFEFC